MGLSFKDKWIWDFWFAKDNDDYHVFYLQASNSLKTEHERHFNVSIGHAVSQDLMNWTVLPDAIHPSPADSDSLDNFTTWTGSVFKQDGLWYMFYTGTSRKEKGLVQRVFFATSHDLITWTKHGEPVIETDVRWYEKLDLDSWFDEAWRDPWVVKDDSGLFHAFITARAKDGPADARGVVAHAISKDLLSWEVMPPVSEAGEFGYLEVPQVMEIKGKYYMFFTVTHDKFSKERQSRSVLETGTHYLVSDDLLGPYSLSKDKFMAANEHGSHYSGKVIENPKGELMFMAFENYTPEGDFVGALSNPMPVVQDSEGDLSVQLEPLTK